MTFRIESGPIVQDLDIDTDGHRTYKVEHIVMSNNRLDGPWDARRTPGLPLPGAAWSFGNDLDIWASCHPQSSVKQLEKNEPHYVVTNHFSTKPWKRCQDITIENPLLEPDDYSGSFVRYMREAAVDLFGNPITNSSHEPIKGPQVEFDHNRPKVVIKQNVVNLQLDVLAQFTDAVNLYSMWGLPPRTIKLSATPWNRKLYGLCFVYYERTLEFDIRYETFDRVLLDEGTRVLRGYWKILTRSDSTLALKWQLRDLQGNDVELGQTGAPDPTNPSHFIRFVDPDGNAGSTVLDGAGKPYNPLPQVGLSSVTPGGSCPGTAIQAGVAYGPFSVAENATASHWFKIAGATGTNRVITIKVVTDPTGRENEILTGNTQGGIQGVGSPHLTTTLSNTQCDPLPSGNVGTPNISGDTYTRVGTSNNGDLNISVDVDDSHPAFTYTIGVLGVQQTQRPGLRYVYKHPGVDFSLLGIPPVLPVI